jgi:tRNA nucleotidyltransferase (CCA-adding enzyme)
VLGACEADYRGRHGHESRAYPQSQAWRHAAAAARSVDAGAIARACADPACIPERLHAARAAAIGEALKPAEQ